MPQNCHWMALCHLANVSMNRKRKSTTQCLGKGLSFMNVSHKESSETLENIP